MFAILLIGIILVLAIIYFSGRRLYFLQRENQRLITQTLQEKQALSTLSNQLQAAIKRGTCAEQKLNQLNEALEAQLEVRVLQRTAMLERQANYDSLTGLANRQLLQDRLSHALAQSRRNHTELAVLFVDLDRFKIINDSLGHDAGDELLKIIAARLQDCVRRSDTVARFGGDEFVLVLEKLSSAKQIVSIAAKILEAINAPLNLHQQSILLGGSIGVSCYPADGNEARLLLKYADNALQQAKQQGRNRVCFYGSELRIRAEQRIQMETDLQTALQDDSLILHYQPQIDLLSNAVIGVEALLRWHHPKHRQIPTRTLLSIAESSGLSIPISTRVLQNACLQLKQWQEQGFSLPSVAINLFSHQLLQADFINQIDHVLRATGLEPKALKLEVTEAMLMQDRKRNGEILKALNDRGVQVAIDDFGSGYSSIGALQHLPLDELKIDQSFVANIMQDHHDANIVAAIIGLGHALGLRVVAEGVENAQQLEFVRARGADAAQGFYFGRPQTADALQSWWRERQ